jgi:hypothetical protein
MVERVALVREQLGYVDPEQVRVEQNPVVIDDRWGGHSYLEQVRLWEVLPGEGENMREAIIALPQLLRDLEQHLALEASCHAELVRSLRTATGMLWTAMSDAPETAAKSFVTSRLQDFENLLAKIGGDA